MIKLVTLLRMIKFIFAISSALCISNIRSGTNVDTSIYNTDYELSIESTSYINTKTSYYQILPYYKDFNELNKLSMILQLNNMVYLLEDADVDFSGTYNDSRKIRLVDGMDIFINDGYLGVYLNDKDNLRIHDVKYLSITDDSLLFELKDGEKVIIKDTITVEKESDGVYIVNPTDEEYEKSKYSDQITFVQN